MMNNTMSLCITYSARSGNQVRNRAYRIADYSNGRFWPINPMDFSDRIETYCPRWIKEKIGYEADLNHARVNSWNVEERHGIDGLYYTTYSFAEDVNFYEVVFSLEACNCNTSKIQQALCDGFEMPDGVSNELLIVVGKRNSAYVAFSASKTDFSCVDGKYCFVDEVTDMVHAKHYFEMYTIPMQDVFDTKMLGNFFLDDGRIAKPRAFYCFNKLPESFEKLQTVSLHQYVPVFVNRYLRNTTNRTGFTKTTIQKFVAEMRNALSAQSELEEFLLNTGYSLSTVVEALPTFENAINTYLTSLDDIDTIIESQVANHPILSQKYLKAGKEAWIKTADDERERINKETVAASKELDERKKELLYVEDAMENANKAVAAAYAEVDRLVKQKAQIEDDIAAEISSVDARIGTIVANHYLLKNLNNTGIKSKTECQMLPKTVEHSEENDFVLSGVSVSDKYASTHMALSKSLKALGFTSSTNELAHLLLSATEIFDALIVPGYCARQIATALNAVLYGSGVRCISIVSGSVNYTELRDSLDGIGTGIVLVENLLDSCNEAAVFALIKDFPNVFFVFSIESDDTLSLISSGIWNYALYVDSDLTYTGKSTPGSVNARQTDPEIIKAEIAECDPYNDYEVEHALLQLSTFARRRHLTLIAFLASHNVSIPDDSCLSASYSKLLAKKNRTAAIMASDEKKLVIPESIINTYLA